MQNALSYEQEKRREIKTAHRKFKRGLKPEIGKVLFGMSTLEQAPRFGTNKHPISMNS
jgi:hypothetical protein